MDSNEDFRQFCESPQLSTRSVSADFISVETSCTTSCRRTISIHIGWLYYWKSKLMSSKQTVVTLLRFSEFRVWIPARSRRSYLTTSALTKVRCKRIQPPWMREKGQAKIQIHKTRYLFRHILQRCKANIGHNLSTVLNSHIKQLSTHH